MNDESKDFLATLIVGIIGIVMLWALTLIPDYFSCAARWSESSMQTSWGPIQGCKVQLPDGRWLPEDRVREIPITENK